MTDSLLWKRCRVVKCYGTHDDSRNCVCHLVNSRQEIVLWRYSKNSTTTYRALGRREFFKARELKVLGPAWVKYVLLVLSVGFPVWMVWSWSHAQYSPFDTSFRWIGSILLVVAWSLHHRMTSRV